VEDEPAGADVGEESSADATQETANDEPPEPDAANHVCEECGRAFDSQQGLAGHSRVHN
jgi:hypothetical protein